MPSDSSSPESRGEKKMKVFISNAAASHDLAALISSRLQQAGIDASSDQTEAPPAGSEMRGWLKSQIEDSDGVVMLVTPDTVDSQWMQYELGLASGMDRLVIPVVVDVASDHLPEQFGKHQVCRLDDLDQVERLIRESGADERSAPRQIL